MRVAFILGTLAIGACKSSREIECGPATYELQGFLESLPYKPSLAVPPAARLLERAELPHHRSDEPIVFHLSKRGVFLDGRIVEEYEVRERVWDRRSTKMALAIDQDVSWDRVVELGRAAVLAGVDQVVFLYEGKRPAVPPRTPLDDDLDKLDSAGERVSGMATMLKQLIENCPSLRGEIAVMKNVKPESRAVDLIRKVPEALRECDCKTDLPALRSLLYRMITVQPAAFAFVKVMRDGQRLELPRDMPWREAGLKIKPNTTIWLAMPGDDGGAGSGPGVDAASKAP